jgi:ParB family transcriptional regulator, chromosome partitioning protein
MSLLAPDPEQPRKFFDEQALAELQASIASHGVLQPVLVREGGEGMFIIVSGERRYQAAKNAGLETIPAILTDGEPAEISIIENLLRENLTAIEEAEAIVRPPGCGRCMITVWPSWQRRWGNRIPLFRKSSR